MKKLYSTVFLFACLFNLTKAQNVGIGTNTPHASAQLDVTSTTRGMLIPRMSAAQRLIITNPATGLLIYQTDGLSGFYYNTGSPSSPQWIVLTSSATAGTSQWVTNGSDIYYNLGRGGIGTTNPESILHLAELNSTTDGSSGTYISVQNTIAVTGVGYMSGIRFRTDGVSAGANARYKSAIFHRKTNLWGVGNLYFAVNSAPDNSSATFADTKMTIQGDGKVGIGTTNPLTTLDVVGNASINGPVGIGTTNPESILHLAELNSTTDGSTGTFISVQNTIGLTGVGYISGIRFRTDGVGPANARYKSAIFHRKTNLWGVGNLCFAVNSTPDNSSATFADTKMTIQGDGNVGIGTTTPNHTLELKLNSSLSKVQLMLNEDDNDYARMRFSNNTGGTFWDAAGYPAVNNTDARMNFYYSGLGDVLSLHGDGTAYVNGAIVLTSDSRLKTNINPITNVLSELMHLHGYTYNWKKEFNRNDKLQIGFLAQEVEKYFPELVATDEKGYKAVNYQNMTPLLLEGLKEQEKIIEEQNVQIKNQGKKIDVLQQQLDEIKQKLGMK